MQSPGVVARGWLGPMQSPGTVGPGVRVPCGRLVRGLGPSVAFAPMGRCRAAGRFRRRWVVVVAVDGSGVGWRSPDHQPGGPAASPPRGPRDDGPGTPRPDWPDRSGRRAASAADDEPHTRPTAAHSRETHSHRHEPPGRSVGRSGRPGWPGRPPTAGSARPQAPGATAPPPPTAAPQPLHPTRISSHRTLNPARISAHRSSISARVSDHWSFLPARVWGHRSLVGARGLAPRSLVDAVAGVGVAMAARLAGDQHPGHRPITGQPPTRLRIQWTHRAGLTTNGMAAAQEAVQVHGDRELRADPAGLGEPPTL